MKKFLKTQLADPNLKDPQKRMKLELMLADEILEEDPKKALQIYLKSLADTLHKGWYDNIDSKILKALKKVLTLTHPMKRLKIYETILNLPFGNIQQTRGHIYNAIWRFAEDINPYDLSTRGSILKLVKMPSPSVKISDESIQHLEKYLDNGLNSKLTKYFKCLHCFVRLSDTNNFMQTFPRLTTFISWANIKDEKLLYIIKETSCYINNSLDFLTITETDCEIKNPSKNGKQIKKLQPDNVTDILTHLSKTTDFIITNFSHVNHYPLLYILMIAQLTKSCIHEAEGQYTKALDSILLVQKASNFLEGNIRFSHSQTIPPFLQKKTITLFFKQKPSKNILKHDSEHKETDDKSIATWKQGHRKEEQNLYM